MRRVLVVAAIAASSLLLGGGVAQAQDPPADDPVPPAFAPPAPAPVVDTDSAEAFTLDYVSDNGRALLREGGVRGLRDRRAVRVVDAQAACLQSPIVDTRFGCVFTLRALVISNRHHGWDGWGHSAHKSSKRGHKGDKHRRHFRIRNYGCLGFLRIDGGPTATPTADVVQVECARVPRGDIEAPEPVM
jgi:hypothetical protein